MVNNADFLILPKFELNINVLILKSKGYLDKVLEIYMKLEIQNPYSVCIIITVNYYRS